MTAPPDLYQPPAVASPGPVTVIPIRRRRRWPRAVIPFGVLLLFWLWTGAAHFLDQPSLSDPGTLSPGGTGADGSSRLAQRLTQQGLSISRATSTADALAQLGQGDATLFAPTPDYLNGTLLNEVEQTGGRHRVVMVRPGLVAQLSSPVPIFGLNSRWATKTVAPGCGSELGAAGPAAAMHDFYEPYPDGGHETSILCYHGGVVGMRSGATEVVYVGASEPFRNAFIDEDGNAALATSLLSPFARVIWLDVHKAEPRVAAQVPKLELPKVKLPQYRRDDQNRTGTGISVIDTFPPQLWAGLIVVAGAAVVLALARGRRLGAPVAEPLPVLVPAAEAVTGRGRLYQRIHARAATLETLRAAGLARIARVLYPFGAAPVERDLLRAGPVADQLVAQVAARTGASDTEIRSVLYDPIADSDEALTAAVARLDAVVAAVLLQPPPTRNHEENR